MILRIAPFTSADAPVITSWVLDDRELRWLAPKSRPPLTPEKITAWRNDLNTQHVLRISPAATPVGYAEISRSRVDQANRWLGHIILAPACRGRGLGIWFVDRLLEMAFADREVTCVSLVVFPDNHAAIACYEHCGFQFTRDETHRFGSHAPRCRLRRFDLHRPAWNQRHLDRPIAGQPAIECHNVAHNVQVAAEIAIRPHPHGDRS